MNGDERRWKRISYPQGAGFRGPHRTPTSIRRMEMNYWRRLQITGAANSNHGTRVVMTVALLGISPLMAGGVTPPPTPPAITPPSGNVAFLLGHAAGTQNYICLPPTTTGGSNVWTFFSPQATLSVPLFGKFTQQIATHFLSPDPAAAPPAQPSCTLSTETNEIACPTWQSSFDSSEVWGTKTGSINAGTDPSCPNTGAIPCLLLKALSTQAGPNGFGIFTKIT